MKRLLAVTLLVGGLAATAIPAAEAAPYCGPIAGVNCTNGTYYCRIYIAPRTCIHTS